MTEDRQAMKQQFLNAKQQSQNQSHSLQNSQITAQTMETTAMSSVTLPSIQKMDAIEDQLNKLEFSTRVQYEKSAANFQSLVNTQQYMYQQQHVNSAVMSVLAQGITEIANQTNVQLTPQTLSIAQATSQGCFLMDSNEHNNLSDAQHESNISFPKIELPANDESQDSQFYSPVNEQFDDVEEVQILDETSLPISTQTDKNNKFEHEKSNSFNSMPTNSTTNQNPTSQSHEPEAVISDSNENHCPFISEQSCPSTSSAGEGTKISVGESQPSGIEGKNP